MQKARQRISMRNSKNVGEISLRKKNTTALAKFCAEKAVEPSLPWSKLSEF